MLKQYKLRFYNFRLIIFLLAISKSDYEEAMAIYELFVTFVRERSMSRLLGSDSFDSFKAVALDCLSRS